MEILVTDEDTLWAKHHTSV